MLPSCCPRLLRRVGVLCAVLTLAFGLQACGNGGDASSDATEEEAAAGSITASMPDTASVWTVLQTDDRFTTLTTAIDSARLDSQLTHGGPYTLFAPTNDAFGRLPDGTVDDLLAERQDRLRTILLYHVVSGRTSSSSITGTDTLTTLAGPGLPIGLADGAVLVGGDVSVLAADVETANGVIHVIDGVLRPPEDDE